MCLVAFSWKNHPDFPLIISANRDEFFDRPSSPLHQWESGIYAGQDLKSGGTWMGFHPDGRWSLVTNYRDLSKKSHPQISRGKLVLDYLEGNEAPDVYLDRLESQKASYDGFNLLVSDGDRLFYYSNFGDTPQEILPGIHGLSNGLINAHWPKSELAKNQMRALKSSFINPEDLLQILKSTETYPLSILPKTGVPQEKEIQLSSQFIRIPPNYGTVSSSAVLRNKEGKTELLERSYEWDARHFRESHITFQT